MKIDYLLKINGYSVPNIVKFKAYREDTDSSSTGRNAAAEMIRYRVARIPKLEIEIGMSTQYEMQTLQKKLAPASIAVEWFDSETCTFRSGTFYSGAFTPEFKGMNPIIYAPCSFNLISYKGDEGHV